MAWLVDAGRWRDDVVTMLGEEDDFVQGNLSTIYCDSPANSDSTNEANHDERPSFPSLTHETSIPGTDWVAYVKLVSMRGASK